MSYKRKLIHFLDRPGGRFLLGKIATHFVRRMTGIDLEILYANGLWTHRVGPDFIPDSLKFDYKSPVFATWKSVADQRIADTNYYWLQHYHPQDGDVIVDVGAGRGEDTLTFSRRVGGRGRVIAIEAHPFSFAILKSFCQLNRLTNVTALHLALMDKPGTVRIAESESSWMEHAIDYSQGSSGIEVPANTLDEVCRRQGLREIAFLKMNIEGAERDALCGMESVISGVRQICVACHDFRSEHGDGEHYRTRDFVEKFLVKHGFTLAPRRDDPRDYVRDHVFGVRN